MIEMFWKVRKAVKWSTAGVLCLALVGLSWTPDAAASGRGAMRPQGDGDSHLDRGRVRRTAMLLSRVAPGTRLLGVRDVAPKVEQKGGPVDVLVPDPRGVVKVRAWESRPLYDWVEDVKFETTSRESIVWLPVSSTDEPQRRYVPITMILMGTQLWCGEVYKVGPLNWGPGGDERLARIERVELRGSATQDDAEREKWRYRVKCESGFFASYPVESGGTVKYVPPLVETKPFTRIETLKQPFLTRQWYLSDRVADHPVDKDIRGYRVLHLANGLADPRNAYLTESALRDEQASGCESVVEVPVRRRVEASFPAAKGQPVLFRKRKSQAIRTGRGHVDRYRVVSAAGRKRVQDPKSVTEFYGIQEGGGQEEYKVLVVEGTDGPWYWPFRKVESWLETRVIHHPVTWKHIPISKVVVEESEEELPNRAVFHLSKGLWEIEWEYGEYDELSDGVLYEQPGVDGRIPESWGAPRILGFVLPDGTRFDKDSPKAWAYTNLMQIPEACEASPEPVMTAGRPGTTGPASGSDAGGTSWPGLMGKPGEAQMAGSPLRGQMAKRRFLTMADAPTGLAVGDPVISGDVSAGRAARHASVAAQRKLLGAQEVQSAGSAHGPGQQELLDDLFARARLGELHLVDQRGQEVFRGVLRGRAIMLQAQPGGPTLVLARGSRHAHSPDGRTAIEIVSARQGLLVGTFRTPAGTWTELRF